MRQIIELDGFTLEIEAPEAPALPYAGDWYPKVHLTLRAPGIVAMTDIEPAKATEVSTAMRLAVNATRTK